MDPVNAAAPRPLIGVCSRPLNDPWGQGGCVAIISNYAERVFEAGGIPLGLPYHPDAEGTAAELADRLDGVLFTGGSDIDGTSFDGQAYDSRTHHPLGETMPQRDGFEAALLSACWERDVPCLGICRGLQIMNVFRGGTLVRDVTEQDWSDKAPITVHVQDEPYDALTHSVVIEPNSELYQIIGSTETRVNSLHHLAISHVPRGGHVVARAEDGTPEGIEFPERTFFMGVQWHPEIMRTQPELFRAFVDAARARMLAKQGR